MYQQSNFYKELRIVSFVERVWAVSLVKIREKIDKRLVFRNLQSLEHSLLLKHIDEAKSFIAVFQQS